MKSIAYVCHQPDPCARSRVRQRRPRAHWLVWLLALCLAMAQAHASAFDAQTLPPLPQLLQIAGAPAGSVGPNPGQWATSPTQRQQFPLYRALMAQPLQAPYRAGMLAHEYKQALASVHDLFALTGAVAGLEVSASAEQHLQRSEERLRLAADPLADSLAWMAALAPRSHWQPRLPSQQRLPGELRFELALMLSSIGRAHQFLQLALARMPPALTPGLLRRQALDGELLPFEEPDYRPLLALIDRQALLAGMLDLVAAVERLKGYVSSAKNLPIVAWRLKTPMGEIVVDTTGRDNRYRLQDPLLVLDVGGDDHYEFLPRSAGHRISVLLDHQGNDHYLASAPGADPSAATLGYGILWDTEGDDYYQGTQQAQASALFGAALLVDGGGNNQFVARSHAQAHAIGGLALLLGGSGNDQYTAQTHAQGSGGPLGVAVLLDPAGDDHYLLNNTPLIRESPQLPQHNTSMGQGAGRGLRADPVDGRASSGGIGILLDLAGNDHYEAQVFAQGVGYQEGLGLLIDDGGNDQFDAAWYAMGAGAHSGAGVLLKRGDGNDSYRASHSMVLGAAHDFSVGVFVDEGGDDQYMMGDLGLGAAHDNSTALFVDAAGDDRYQVTAQACRAFGTAQLSEWGSVRESLLNLALFMDLGGTDTYPAHCKGVRDNANWSAARTWPQLKLPSEAGAGVDGEFALPFVLRPLTSAQKSATPQ